MILVKGRKFPHDPDLPPGSGGDDEEDDDD